MMLALAMSSHRVCVCCTSAWIPIHIWTESTWLLSRLAMAISRLGALELPSWGRFCGFFSVLDAIRARTRRKTAECNWSGIGIVQNVECATTFSFFFGFETFNVGRFWKNQIYDPSPLSQWVSWVSTTLIWQIASFAAKPACDRAWVGTGTGIGTMAVLSGAVRWVSLWSLILSGYCVLLDDMQFLCVSWRLMLLHSATWECLGEVCSSVKL